MVQAAVGAVGTVLGALGGQSKQAVGTYVPRQDLSTAAIAMAPTRKAARMAQQNAREDRISAIVQDPAVIGILTLLAGVWVAENMPLSGDPDSTRNNALRSALISAVILASLGRAGVGDITTAVVAAAGGMASLLESLPSLPRNPLGIGDSNWYDSFLPSFLR